MEIKKNKQKKWIKLSKDFKKAIKLSKIPKIYG